MTDAQQRAAAKKFAADWKGKGYEKGQSQPFWLSLLRDVYGVEHPEQFILFEEQVHLLSNFSQDEKDALVKAYPQTLDFFRPFIGAWEFLTKESGGVYG